MAASPCHLRQIIPKLTIGGVVLYWLAQPCTADQRQGDGGLAITQPVSSLSGAIPAAPGSTITVGKNGREFVPNNTRAWAGDVMEFHFYPGNYSVVRSAYMFPCIPIENTGAGRQGFWSGFIDNKSPSPAKWRLTLTDTNPIFFYSSVGDDCDRYGMVGGINVQENELRMQHDMALDSPSVVQPSAASYPTLVSVPSTSASGTSKVAEPTMPVGIIVGAALGGVTILILFGAMLYLCGHRSRKGREKSQPAQGESRWPMMRAVRNGSGGDPRSGGSSSAGKTSSTGSGHHQHHYHTRHTRISSSTYLPTRDGHGILDGTPGGDTQDSEKKHGTERWQLQDGQTNICNGLHHDHHHHSPPFGTPALQQPRHAAAVPGSPIIDGDTIYVPVHRSTILSADYGGPSPSYYTPPRSPPANSPVSLAAQMLHRRWMAQEQIDSSDAESGVFGIGVRRFPSTRSGEQTLLAATPVQGPMAGNATLQENMGAALSAPESPLPPLPGEIEVKPREETPGMEQHVAEATPAQKRLV